MFGTIGGPELLLILVIALIVFGPRKLPDIGKSMGKMLYEFRKASNDFKRTIEDEVEADKVRSAAPPQIESPPPPQAPESAGSPSLETEAVEPSVEPAQGTVSREAGEPPLEPK